MLNRVPALIVRNVTSVRWQMTLCGPILHMSSCSGEVLLRNAILCFLYLLYILNFVCCEASIHVLSTPSSSSSLPSLPMSDLLAAESLMDEEETTSRCCEGRLTSDDADPFASVLHLTDHCLYRIVRWARNRPDFANISVILHHCVF